VLVAVSSPDIMAEMKIPSGGPGQDGTAEKALVAAEERLLDAGRVHLRSIVLVDVTQGLSFVEHRTRDRVKQERSAR
jgi:hypothetical protein